MVLVLAKRVWSGAPGGTLMRECVGGALLLIALSVGAPDCSSYCLAKETTVGAARQSAPPTAAAAPVIAPAGSERLRAEIHSIEGLLPQAADRGAALFLLADHYARLGEQAKALALLKECVGLNSGFIPDPTLNPSLRLLESNAEFRELLEQARRATALCFQRADQYKWRKTSPRFDEACGRRVRMRSRRLRPQLNRRKERCPRWKPLEPPFFESLAPSGNGYAALRATKPTKTISATRRRFPASP